MYAAVTRLQSFNLLRTTEWMTVERFTEQIQSEYVPDDPALIGRDFHKFMDIRPITESDVRSDYDFEYDKVNVVEAVNSFTDPDILRESQGSIIVPTSLGDLFVPGRADAISGLTVKDYKTSAKDSNPEMLFDSIQWKIYLEMFACDEFLFCPVRVYGKRGQVIRFERESDMNLYRYPGMWDEICSLAEDFVQFMTRQGLQEFMKTRKERAA